MRYRIGAGRRGHATLRDRATYGNPIDFRGMPVNEQGVVLLFWMLAKELGCDSPLAS
jgi:hypothetical protein